MKFWKIKKENKIIIKKNILFIIFLLFCSALSVEAKHFKDVPAGFWDIQEIDRITNSGIMEGISNDYFMPKRYITRAEYAVSIIKTIKQENIQVQNAYAFDDINNSHPAWQYIIRALDLDILKPADRFFYPNDFITRTEMLTFLVNILKSEHITKKEALVALQNNYADYDDIPDWFKVTAGKAEVLGVIAKEPPRENYLDYDAYVTRAQFAYFLDRLKEITEGYIKEKYIEEISPKIVEEGGIIIENTIRKDDIVTLPVKTVLPVIISGQLKSGQTKPGTMFQAKFADNIVDEENHLLLSKNIILIGKVLSSERSLPFIKNGSIFFELSSANKDGNFTRIQGLADCIPPVTESNKITRTAASIVKGKNFIAKDSQILYVRLYKPMRINIVTGDILD